MNGLSQPPACSKQRQLCFMFLLLVDEPELVRCKCNAEEAVGHDSHHFCLGVQVLLCRRQQGRRDCRSGLPERTEQGSWVGLLLGGQASSRLPR